MSASTVQRSAMLEAASERWALALRVGKLRGHIRLTIADLDDIAKGSCGRRRMELNIIRERLSGALREDEKP
jgi:hypothetical protein